MKDQAMNRPMFRGKEEGTLGSGIMAALGSMGEGEDDEMDMEEMSAEEMPPMARTPQNPEILMNTLRGDVRSVNARYMELAQMVGEEAAMETPPEVLALLQSQLAQQQMGGIGSLPGAPGMQPPTPPEPPPPPPMPPAMPPGMEGAGPFPPGGAEQAPPTPDGLPPLQAAAGAFVTKAARFGNEAMDAFRSGVRAMDERLGNVFMSPQPTLQPIMGADGRPIFIQGRENLRMGPSGIQPGTGTRLEKGMTMGDLRTPTFSEGAGMSMARAAEQYPTAAAAIKKAAPYVGGAGALTAGAALLPGEEPSPFVSQADQIPPQGPPLRDAKGNLLYGNFPPFEEGFVDERIAPITPPAPPVAEEAPGFTPAPPAALTEDQAAAPTKEEKGDQGMAKLIEMLGRPSAKSKVERIKEEQAEYAPLFKELLGDTKEELRTNALLLLADAGFKFAGSRKGTLGGALAEAVADLPKGLIAITSQLRDRGIKVKTASLQQAINSVEAQDKLTKESMLKVLELKNKRDIENQKAQLDIYKTQMQYGTPTYERLPFGHVVTTIKGQPPKQTIDYNDPTVQSAINSTYTLTDANPYVSYRGKSPTTVQQTPDQLKDLSKQMASSENVLRQIEEAEKIVMDAYGPSAFFTSVKNNLIVPVVPDALVSPNVDKAAKFAQLKYLFNTISKESADTGGRVAVQQQEWERQNNAPLAGPDEFWKNPEIAAKLLSGLKTMHLNNRQRVLEQAGLVGERYEMRTPNTGTQNDPFVLPDPKLDPAGYKNMSKFLAQTLGTIDQFDSRTKIWIVGPDGKKDWVTPDQLRKFGQ